MDNFVQVFTLTQSFLTVTTAVDVPLRKELDPYMLYKS